MMLTCKTKNLPKTRKLCSWFKMKDKMKYNRDFNKSYWHPFWRQCYDSVPHCCVCFLYHTGMHYIELLLDHLATLLPDIFHHIKQTLIVFVGGFLGRICFAFQLSGLPSPKSHNSNTVRLSVCPMSNCGQENKEPLEIITHENSNYSSPLAWAVSPPLKVLYYLCVILDSSLAAASHN